MCERLQKLLRRLTRIWITFWLGVHFYTLKTFATLVVNFIWYLVNTDTRNYRDYDDDAIERGDEYIDKLLKDMFEDRVDEYDPYKMEDSVVGFSKKVVFVNVTGEAKLFDGTIKGLRTLHRSDHCSLEERGGRLHVKANLGAGVLDFHYSGSAKFMNFGPTITVEGTLSYVEVFMEFTVDSKTGKDGKLTKFTFDDMRGMKVWVTGLGPLNWAVNPIIKGVTTIFKRFVRNFLEKQVKAHIEEHLPNFKFPVEGNEEPETTTPTTEEPPTEEPETTTPQTEEPPTEEPETTPPETEEPPTEEPETTPPETEEPPTEEPETTPPETEEPPTEEPETNPPETEEPEPEEPESEPEEPEYADSSETDDSVLEYAHQIDEGSSSDNLEFSDSRGSFSADDLNAL